MSKISVFKTSGFTLIELLVVMALVALMASLVAPNAFKILERQSVAIEKNTVANTVKSAADLAFSKKKK